MANKESFDLDLQEFIHAKAGDDALAEFWSLLTAHDERTNAALRAQVEEARADALLRDKEERRWVPEGWCFYTADFSLIASAMGQEGRVMLQRSPEDLKRWHLLSEEERPAYAIYASGIGATFDEAFASAAKVASLTPPLPAQVESRWRKPDSSPDADIVPRLLAACTGQPAKIPWPHRLLHDAVDAIAALRAQVEDSKMDTAICKAAIKGLERAIAMVEKERDALKLGGAE